MATFLAGLGTWQVASAGWIHAKAIVAQQLIAASWQQAWQISRETPAHSAPVEGRRGEDFAGSVVKRSAKRRQMADDGPGPASRKGQVSGDRRGSPVFTSGLTRPIHE